MGNRSAYLRRYFVGWKQRIRLSVYERACAAERVRRFDVGEQMKQRRGQRIDVAARVRAQSLHLLERRVIRRVTEDTRRSRDHRRLPGISLRQAKVEQHNLATRSQLQILWLDIAVDDFRILGVQVVERIAE